MNLGLVGCGYWGKNYVGTIKDVDGASLKYVCDSNEKNIAGLRKKFPDIKFINDYSELLDKGLDGIIVVTPSSTHFDIAEKFLDRGVNVMIEKPITVKSDDAEALCNSADKNKSVLMVGHIFRYHPALVKVKELVDSGELGEIRYLESKRVGLGPIRTDVSSLWDLATHDIYISNYLLGMIPDRVSCTGISHNGKVDDITCLNMRYNGRVLSTIYANWEHPVKERKIYIGGTKKAILFDDIEPSNKLVIYDKGVTYQPSSGDYAEFLASLRDGNILIPKIQNTPPLKNEIEHFLKCIGGEVKCLTDGLDGLNTVRVLEAAENSRNKGGIELLVK
jgi:predicted dehydrogenase